MSLNLPPIPNDQIGENPIWRNWFTRLQKGLTSTTSGSVPVNHNALSAIQGGNATERYHLTAADVSKLAGIATGAEVNVINSVSSTTSVTLAIALRNLTAIVIPSGVDHAQLNNLNSVSYSHLTSAQLTALTTGIETSLHSHKWPMVADTIDVGETVTIPVQRQLIVAKKITNSGTIINNGELFLI